MTADEDLINLINEITSTYFPTQIDAWYCNIRNTSAFTRWELGFGQLKPVKFRLNFQFTHWAMVTATPESKVQTRVRTCTPEPPLSKSAM